MSASLVQTKKGNGGGYVNSFTFSPTGAFTAGNTAIIFLGCGAAGTPTVTDNSGSNTWTKDVDTVLASQRRLTVWRCHNIAGSTPTITVQYGGGQFEDSAYILKEFNDMPTSNPFDQSASATTSAGTSHASGSTGTTTQAEELIVGGCVVDSATPGFTGDATYSAIDSQAGFDSFTSVAFQYKSVSSTGTQSITITTSGNRNGVTACVTYKEAVAAPAANTSNFFQFI